MAIQQRAERTRQTILTSAARAFDTHGYDRTSLARIGAEARVTTGALVFHFATKAELAAAVQERARAITGVTVESACVSAGGSGGTAVEKLVAVTRALIRLFETDCVARAGERLAREMQPAGIPAHQKCPWRREVARLVRRAGDEGALHPGIDATAVVALISYVVQGVELAMRAPDTPADEPWPSEPAAVPDRAGERLERIWELILPSLVPPTPPEPLPPSGDGQSAPSPGGQPTTSCNGQSAPSRGGQPMTSCGGQAAPSRGTQPTASRTGQATQALTGQAAPSRGGREAPGHRASGVRAC
ncbi:TetR/AcrR family transcriptional regulator [Streptomyces sp. OUCMDZ-4982]|uniref:TetR/AcrR family transcriptional regulator n=1 Tax=Streptomyces sp. OUCMDZ-4982 TaxID=2973090 RepID=UPI00215D015A|nr:TetR/AcrR family transcriptional regulator [Streptomyces sp. OUCMDZ-4982]MCR8943356.1 TetR/AcrR family transcriptional regulator [Streptomyces sp. OUCMDZ-4982]